MLDASTNSTYTTTKWKWWFDGGHNPSCLYKKILAGNLYCSPSPPHFVAEIWRWMHQYFSQKAVTNIARDWTFWPFPDSCFARLHMSGDLFATLVLWNWVSRQDVERGWSFSAQSGRRTHRSHPLTPNININIKHNNLNNCPPHPNQTLTHHFSIKMTSQNPTWKNIKGEDETLNPNTKS